MQYEIGQLRRHDSIAGYVVTELTDAYWEANGLLDAMRGPKVYHDRLPALFSPDVIHADLPRHDLFGGEALTAELSLAAYGPPTSGGEVRWSLELDGADAVEGSLPLAAWPVSGTLAVGSMTVRAPDVPEVSEARLRLSAIEADGHTRATNEVRIALLPASGRRTAAPLRIAVHDPLDIWAIQARVVALGHELVDAVEADLVVASELTDQLVARMDAGGRALILVRSRAPSRTIMTSPVGSTSTSVVCLIPDGPASAARGRATGSTSWSWILPSEFDGLPDRNPLGLRLRGGPPGPCPARSRSGAPSRGDRGRNVRGMGPHPGRARVDLSPGPGLGDPHDVSRRSGEWTSRDGPAREPHPAGRLGGSPSSGPSGFRRLA